MGKLANMWTLRQFWQLIVPLIFLCGLATELPAGEPPSSKVPGVVIAHSSAASGIYIGSPSLAVLSNGVYLASHDEFGPKSSEFTRAITQVFRSDDKGQSWRRVATVDGQFWSTLFVHREAVYLLGTDKHHGNAIIRRSPDEGTSWSTPADSNTGLLRADGQYHCAPVPIIEHAGRLWRGMERRIPPQGWGSTYCAGMLSVPVDADLLDATNWTFSNFVPNKTNWLNGTVGGWLEGNAVVTPDNRLVDVLRVETPGYPERAAVVEISADGRNASFDPETGFITFPGGAKKFTIRRDTKSNRYWALATIVPRDQQKPGRPASMRNTLALTSSPDLKNWTVHANLLQHPESTRHGFQYVDWQFDGADIVAACRTSYDDESGGAHNFHDANYLTFHRWKNFRE
jgi:hypothetical protein